MAFPQIPDLTPEQQALQAAMARVEPNVRENPPGLIFPPISNQEGHEWLKLALKGQGCRMEPYTDDAGRDRLLVDLASVPKIERLLPPRVAEVFGRTLSTYFATMQQAQHEPHPPTKSVQLDLGGIDLDLSDPTDRLAAAVHNAQPMVAIGDKGPIIYFSNETDDARNSLIGNCAAAGVKLMPHDNSLVVQAESMAAIEPHLPQNTRDELAVLNNDLRYLSGLIWMDGEGAGTQYVYAKITQDMREGEPQQLIQTLQRWGVQAQFQEIKTRDGVLLEKNIQVPKDEHWEILNAALDEYIAPRMQVRAVSKVPGRVATTPNDPDRLRS